MSKLLEMLKGLGEQLHLKPQHSFTGGVHPQELKKTAGLPSMTCPLPKQIILPMKQHIGDACEPLVKVGDHVLRGQQIAKSQGYLSVPVHASTSGTVTKIEDHVIAHPSGLGLPCIFIEPDGKDEVDESLYPLPNYRSADPIELRERIRSAGLAGLGGAAFPTFIKLVLDQQNKIETVVLNGIECEPWLTNDHQLMLEKAHEIVTGMDILMHMVGSQQGIIAIEDNKMDTVEVMQKTLVDMGLDASVRIEVLPTKYPQGGEKQLIQVLTGKEVPAGRLPIQVGVLSQNVGTSKAIYDAVCLGEALTERMMTVSGDALPNPTNMRVRLGTPVAWLLEQCGLDDTDGIKVIHGGPMMGDILTDMRIPVVKASNGILAMRISTLMQAHHQEDPCIRCGDCGDVCPAGLMPNLLAVHCKEEQFERAEDYNLFDCIECGACSYVCPSHIPLVHYFRFGKGKVAQIRREKAFAEESRKRSETRDARIAQELAEKEEKRRIAKEKKEARAKALAEKQAQEAAEGETKKPEAES
ncbi:electron transport complex subunit RsxC [Ghiorsea bivora]|uniref:electron transport complex subunit RsxC n=1 Tax=Ghiorsea bivora TaxID=1485545 RepID=UPI000A9BE500|nr:electron transport complex subunit RsxC [Ghiorsea bivora]